MLILVVMIVTYVVVFAIDFIEWQDYSLETITLQQMVAIVECSAFHAFRIDWILDNAYPPMVMFNGWVNVIQIWMNAHCQLFEDGSFVIQGCLPWATCAIN